MRLRISPSSRSVACIQRRRQLETAEEFAHALKRQQHQVMHAQSRQRLQRLRAPLTLRGCMRSCPAALIGQVTAADAPQQRVGLKRAPSASVAGRVRAITRQAARARASCTLASQATRKSADAVPVALAPRPLAFDHPGTLRCGQFAPRSIERNAALLGVLHQVLLAFGVGLRLPGANRTGAQRFAFIRDDQPVIDAHRAAEAAAAVAGAHRRIEGKEARDGLAVGQIAFGAVQPARIAPTIQALGRVPRADDVNIDAAMTDAQRRLERLEHAAALGVAEAHPVLDDLDRRGLALDFAAGRGILQEARVALLLQELAHFGFLEVLRHRHRESTRSRRGSSAACARRSMSAYMLSGVSRCTGLAAAAAEQACCAGEQQLQVIVELGHRADGRARSAHRIRLVDGDGGRNSEMESTCGLSMRSRNWRA